MTTPIDLLAEAPALPWRATCACPGKEIIEVSPFDGDDIAVTILGRGTIYLSRADARQMGLALLRGEREAGDG